MRLALDTDVVAAAMRSPRGASAELLRRMDGGKAVLLLTVALALEYEAICTLAEHRLASGLSASKAGIYESPETTANEAGRPPPEGMLIYSRDGHFSVQLMYPQLTCIPRCQAHLAQQILQPIHFKPPAQARFLRRICPLRSILISNSKTRRSVMPVHPP